MKSRRPVNSDYAVLPRPNRTIRRLQGLMALNHKNMKPPSDNNHIRGSRHAATCRSVLVHSSFTIQSISKARAVFVGKVTGSQDVRSDTGTGEHYTMRERYYKFTVLESFKGLKGGEVEVSAGWADSMCLPALRKARRTSFMQWQLSMSLILAFAPDAFWLSICRPLPNRKIIRRAEPRFYVLDEDGL